MFTYRHFIFDLDGTLLDTIEDIGHAISLALKQCGYDLVYDKQSTRALINDGVDALIERALAPVPHDEFDHERVKKVYLPYYEAYQGMACLPFPKMEKTLQKLIELGCDLSIVTNKPDKLAKIIISQKLPQIPFRFICGHHEGIPVKPDPFLIEEILKETGWDKSSCVFVGDSNVDLKIAQNAGLPSVLCTWGYDHYDEALISKANHVISSPEELLQYARSDRRSV